MHNRSCVYGGLSFHISGKSISYHCAHPAVLFSCLYIFQQRLSAYQIVHGLFLQSSQQNINARDLCPKFFAQLACHLGIIHPKATLRHNILEQLFQVIRIRLACTVLAVAMSAADGKAPFTQSLTAPVIRSGGRCAARWARSFARASFSSAESWSTARGFPSFMNACNSLSWCVTVGGIIGRKNSISFSFFLFRRPVCGRGPPRCGGGVSPPHLGGHPHTNAYIYIYKAINDCNFAVYRPITAILQCAVSCKNRPMAAKILQLVKRFNTASKFIYPLYPGSLRPTFSPSIQYPPSAFSRCFIVRGFRSMYSAIA